jgi:cob(I)alamin adenosyltransferase
MKIYTKTGDDGETGLSKGERVLKDDIRVEVNGTLDELNSVLGIAICEISDNKIIELLKLIQAQIFNISSYIASLISNSDKSDTINFEIIKEIEERIDYYSAQLPGLTNFILPGGSRSASYIHLARTVCRRAERRLVTLRKHIDIDKNILIYLNRLSDLFFVLARFENMLNKIPDVVWKAQS